MADIEPLVKWVLLWDIDQLSYNQCHWDIVINQYLSNNYNIPITG